MAWQRRSEQDRCVKKNKRNLNRIIIESHSHLNRIIIESHTRAMVCAHCGSKSHHTGHSACEKYCTLCAQSGHRQKRGTCPYRVCNTCGETGHSARECNPRCKACGSSDHRNFSSFACPEHKCSKCKGALDPKGHNKNNCPGSAVCEACGSSDHRNAKSFECPEHKCTKCKGTLDPKGHNKNHCPEMLNTICTL